MTHSAIEVISNDKSKQCIIEVYCKKDKQYFLKQHIRQHIGWRIGHRVAHSPAPDVLANVLL